jgi:hypothetical protein
MGGWKTGCPFSDPTNGLIMKSGAVVGCAGKGRSDRHRQRVIPDVAEFVSDDAGVAALDRLSREMGFGGFGGPGNAASSAASGPWG